MRHFIESYIDWDRWRPGNDLTDKWVLDRLDLFHNTTLKSILNQTNQNFGIVVHCGQKHKHVTSKYNWHPRIKVVYDKCEEFIHNLNEDYLVMTRIDSDDLFHKDAVKDIQDNLILSNVRECLIFRNCIVWDRISNFIAHWYDKSPPFFTHIYPKKLYQDYSYYLENHFAEHGRAGGRLPQTKELSEGKICVVKHDLNISTIRKGIIQEKMNLEEIKKSWENQFITCDHDKIIKILCDFGIDMEKVK